MISAVQECTAKRSPSDNGVVFTREMNTARLLMSVPMHLRPSAEASTSVVPPPMKGSKTVSPGFVKALIAAWANKGENLAG
jgi:hypothetical protein